MQRLSMSQCPACERPNEPQARFCSACGTPLVMRCPHCDAINARTRERCHHCRQALRTAPADAAVPPVHPVLVTADDEPPPPDWRLQLREDGLPTQPQPLRAPPPAPGGDPGRDPSAPAFGDPAICAADPDAPRLVPADPPAPAPGPLAGLRPPDLDDRRARRRAAVRRAQLRRRGASAPVVQDVLVLEPDPDCRRGVCRVLLAFGFKPQVAVTAAEARGLALARPMAAAILGLHASEPGAAELCLQLRDAPRGRPAALIAIVDRDRHADRVRMQLAGAEQVLFRPPGRGDLARALEALGIPLPQDPRHGTPPA